MPFDSVNIKYLSLELNESLKDGRIDKITMPQQDTVVFFIRSQSKNLALAVCCNPSGSKIALTGEVFENPAVTPSFLMHLRKNVSGAKINSVSCAPYERIINISIIHKNELGIAEERTLCVELMGKYSNLILLNSDNTVSECLRHISCDLTSKRIVLPGIRYTLPQQQNKIDCSSIICLSRLLGTFTGGSLSGFILSNVSGFAATTINEAIFKALKIKNVPCLLDGEIEKLSESLCGMYEEKLLKPCVSVIEKRVNDFHFTPYLSIDNAEYIFFGTMSEAIEYYYSVGKNSSFIGEKAKRLTACVKTALQKAGKRLAFNINKLEECRDLDSDKLFGELVTANIYKIKKGAKSVKVENYYEEDCPVIDIALDDKLSPQMNAQRMYKRYNKKKKTIDACKALALQNEDEIKYLESVEYSISVSTSFDELGEIERELIEGGYLKEKAQKKKEKPKKIGISKIEFEGYTISFGKNNVQNDFLTKNAAPHDIWLHAKDIHGSHVVISNTDRSVPPVAALEKAASIAAYFSKAQQSGKTAVDYTFVKNVHKPKGASPGKVVYENYNTIITEPKEP